MMKGHAGAGGCDDDDDDGHACMNTCIITTTIKGKKDGSLLPTKTNNEIHDKIHSHTYTL